MTSTTTNVYPEENGLKIQRSAWEAIMFNYLLLPTLCAIFLIFIVLIIAFVLIKKKKGSSPSDGSREKSCYTTESFNEVSDVSVYDLINELRNSRIETHPTESNSDPDSAIFRHFSAETNRGMRPLSSSLRTEDIISRKTVILKSVTPFPWRKGYHNDSHLQTDTMGSLQSVEHHIGSRNSMDLQGDGRVYETLDRYWKKKGAKDQTPKPERATCNQTSGRLQEKPKTLIRANNEIKDGVSININTTSNRAQLTHVKQDFNNISYAGANNTNEIDEKQSVGYLKDCKKENPVSNSSTICKLSFFPIAESTERPQFRRMKNFYYVIQNNNGIELGTDDDDYISFQSTSPVSLHFPQKSRDCIGPHNSGERINALDMKPLSEPALIQIFEEKVSNVSSPVVSGIANIANFSQSFEGTKKTKTTKSNPRKKCRLEKSESFSETHCIRPSESVRKFSLGEITLKQNSTPSNCDEVDENEADRILSKLGPLPPIPHPTKQGIKRNHNINLRSDSWSIDIESHFKKNSRFKQKPDDYRKSSSTPCNDHTAQHEFNQIGIAPRPESSERKERFTTDSGETGHDSFAKEKVSTTSARDSVKAKSDNHYFILEPTQDSPFNCSTLNDGGNDELCVSCKCEADKNDFVVQNYDN